MLPERGCRRRIEPRPQELTTQASERVHMSKRNPDEKNKDAEERTSIWSVFREWRGVYFALFVTQGIIGIAVVIWYELTQRTDDGWYETLREIDRGVLEAGAAAAVSSIIVTDTARNIMVLGGIIEDALRRRRERQIAEAVEEALEKASSRISEGRAEGREEGRAEGREEERSRWTAWNARRRDAESKGQPFDEPPPGA